MKIELYKIIKSKQYIFLVVSLFLFIIVALLFMFYNRDPNEINLFSLIYQVFAFNSDIFFPTVSIAFFSSIITKEFQDKTIKMVIGSVYTRQNIIIGKFLASSIVFSVAFLITVLTAFFIAYLLPISSIIYIDYEQLGTLNVFGRMMLITLSTLVFLISFGSFAFLVALIVRNQGLTMLIAIGLLMFYILIPSPDWLTDYIFIGKGVMFYTAFSFLEIPYLEAIKTVLVCILYLLTFIICSTIFFNRFELKDGS